jgi:3-oxoacyl-[acyl-carrier protein] reductase
VLAARTVSALEELAMRSKAGRRALAVQADMTDPASIEQLATATIAAFGKVDILANNAGIMAAPVPEHSGGRVGPLPDLNFKGTCSARRPRAHVRAKYGR